MALLDQYGNPITISRPFRSATRDGSRPWQPTQLNDLHKLLPKIDWATLISASRTMYNGMGFASGAINQRADYLSGDAWLPVFQGENDEWGKRARDIIVEQWFPNCEVRGEAFGWQKLIELDSIAIDRDGDVFTLLTTDNPFPQLQKIEAHRVGDPRENNFKVDGKLTSGMFAGRRIENGIVLNEKRRPIGIHVLGDEPSEDKFYPASAMIHHFDPRWHSQSRGLPVFYAALNELRDALQSQDWEQMAMLAVSAHTIVEKNEYGMPDPYSTDNIVADEGETTPKGATLKQMGGGMYRYLQLEGELGQLEHARPGDDWEKFQTRLYRIAATSINWPLSMVWEATGQGTAEYSDVEKADKSVKRRCKIMQRPERRALVWAVAKLMKSGKIPQNEIPSDWWRWGFSKPRKLTIHDSKNSKSRIEEIRLGNRNMTADVMENGYESYQQFLYERANEVADRKLIAAQVSQQRGVEIDSREMLMLTANETEDEDSNATATAA